MQVLSPRLPPSTPAKRAFDQYLPFVYRPVRRAYHSWRDWRFQKRYRRLVDVVTGQVGWRVQTGPFEGMQYVERALSSALLPKILGTYEGELHAVLENLLANRYETVVDIGAAEGYYAVGMARRIPGATVYAYDLDPDARALCGALASRNGVGDRVVVRGRFTADQLADLPRGLFLAVCDVDGYETELFKPERARAWMSSDLIVELHDCLGLPCEEVVSRCLADTHDLEVIPSATSVFPPSLDLPLSEDDRRLAVDELRPPQAWLIARRRPAAPPVVAVP
jgi:hypothetical protein